MQVHTEHIRIVKVEAYAGENDNCSTEFTKQKYL